MWIDFVRFITNRRIIIDIGACDIKVLLVEKRVDQIKVIDSRLIDYTDGGYMTQDESSVELQQILETLGEYPIVLIIPEHLSIARLTQFTSRPKRELNHDSLRELSGWFHLGDGEEILWELRLIKNLPGYINSGVLTMSRALDVDDQVQRLGVHEDNLIRVTTPSSSLADTYIYLSDNETSALLIEVGATTTAVVVIEQGQAVFSTNFPIGGESLTEVVCQCFDIPFDEAEMKKREEKIFLDEENTALPFKAALESWTNELAGVLEIQFGSAEATQKELHSRPIYISGGGAQIPGMLDYIKNIYGYNLLDWDDVLEKKNLHHEVASGRFLSALGAGWAPVCRHNLLPDHLRQKRNSQSIQFIFNIFSLLLISGVMIYLIVCSIWQFQDLSDLNNKLDEMERSFGQITTIDNLMRERYGSIKGQKGLLIDYKHSLDWTAALETLEDAQKGTGAWMLLLAEKQSYFTSKSLPSTNVVNKPNGDLIRPTSSNGPSESDTTAEEGPGIISQLVLKGGAEASLNSLQSLVENLRGSGPFENVDKLPADSHESHLSDNYVLSNQTYTLRLDWKGYSEFELASDWTNAFRILLPNQSTNSVQKSNLPPNLKP